MQHLDAFELGCDAHHEPAEVLAAEHPALVVGLVFAVGKALGLPILDEVTPTELKALCALARDRLGALGVEALLCFAQSSPPSLVLCQVLGQLIAAGGAMDVVLGRVNPAGLREDLSGKLLIATDRPIGGAGGELAAVDRTTPTEIRPASAQRPRI